MAYGILPQPGSATGPCIEPCQHIDCQATLRMATDACVVCDQPIGYDTKFCVADQDGRLAHWMCVLIAAEKESA